MLSQITKQISENISQSLAKHAPSQNLGQNFSHQNLAKPAQNLASQATQIKASQSLAPQTQTRQALTRFGNELATNTQRKPTQAVFDFDFIARDKTPELPQPQQTPAKNPPASEEGLSQNPPPTADGLFDNPPPTAEGVRGWVDLPSTPKPQAQPLQARFDELKDFASKIATHTENLSQEAKSLYDSFAKSLKSLSPETLSAKELNKADTRLSEYLANTELAQVSNAQEIILPYFSAKYRAKTEAELAQTFGNEKLAQMRQALQEAKGTHPLSEFGTNYAEFYQDGKGAIAKLIAEASAAKQAGQDFNGQVAGAFSKEIDGAEASIDLVWGNEKMGLEKIIQKHLDDFSDFSGANPHEKVANGLSEIVSKGEVIEKDGVKTIWLKNGGKNYVVGLSKGWKGNGENLWIITSYEKTKGYIPNLRGDSLNLSAYKAEFNPLLTSSDEPLSKEISKKATAANFTEGAAQPNNLTSEIIAKIQEKMKVSKEYAENLAKWHKDSHPFTKEADGTPKVFYHGIRNGTPFEIFDMKKSKNNLGFYFTGKKEVANFYANQNKESKNTYEIFLNIKNPFDLSKPINSTKDLKNLENIGILPPLTKEQKDEFFRLKKIKDEAIKDLKKQGIDLIEISGSWAYGTKNGKLFEFLEAYKDYRGFYTNNGGTITILKPEQMKLYTPAVKQLFKETRWGFYRNDFDLLLSGEYIGALGGISNGYGFDTLKTLLNKKGYDGIKISDYEVVVFDSNQIKAVGNKGTFDGTNPNIYHSSSTAGGGVLGGSIAGVERDDEGNIIGFSPEKFALGFATGASAAKALGSIFKQKQAQNHALKSIKNLQKEYQALQAHNLPLFAKIMSDIPPQTFIKPSKEAKRLSNDIFNKELAQVIQNAVDKDSIKELPQVNFKNISEFRGLFDEVKNNIGYLATPLGKIRVNTQYALHHFTNNTYYKDRTNIKGGFFETFKNPLFIVEDDTKGKGSIYFYKPFYDKDKNMLNLFGIGVNQKGIINFRTYYLDEKKSRLKQLLKSEGVRIKYVAKE